jgi:protein-S-isoprenylcysteine O-methyltransferase Ste14
LRTLELKIPPPVVALTFGVLMWLTSTTFRAAANPITFHAVVAVVFACVGAVIGVSAMALFVRAKTTMNPIKADTATSLVTNGVFRVTRNPMYLSLLLYLIAWAVYLENWLALVFVPLFVIYMNEFQIKPEERAMETLFGPHYAEYKARVRRWV